MNNPWVMKIIALLLALMLYMSVNFDTQTTKSNSMMNSNARYETETLTDVPVSILYDNQNKIVTGIPQSVTLTLEGPKSALTQTKLQKEYEIYADLTNYELGSHQVKLKHRNISDKLDVKIEPQVVTATIEEKVSKNFEVEANFDSNKMRDGYIAEQAIVKPENVEISGSKDQIDRIAYVKAIVEIDDVYETIEKEANVIALDRNLNKLNVDIDPSVVDVTIPVVSPSKKVPFKIVREGALPKGLSIKNIDVSPNEVTVFGPRDVLDKVEFIDDVKLDLSQIKDSTQLKVDVPVPEGAKRVYPEQVTVNVEVDKESTKTFKNLSLSMVGQSQNLNYQFLNPSSGKLDIDVFGSEEVINNISPEDIQVYVNVSNISSGEHDANIEVNGPQNITWSLSTKIAKMKITDKSINEDESNPESEEKDQDSKEKDQNKDSNKEQTTTKQDQNDKPKPDEDQEDDGGVKENDSQVGD
ncbi:CdaR family protein [Bacillus sp. CGMCC 1.16541]|uniref:CdaR family protein n=1 Tax=Bacillus sp. CGMCC 1.16541 TaxID=2185143 RepID=UPI0013A5A7FE|nr:CdaR family protein [Bacillus sp. CGMCC 1.16541]